MIKQLSKFVSWAALVLLIVPALLFLTGKMSLEQVKTDMLIVTVVWFIVAPVWLWNGKTQKQGE